MSIDTKRPFRGGMRRLLRSSASERGFLLIETVIAMVIFAIVCTAIVDMLVSSTSITTYAKQKTLAEQGVSNQIGFIRSLDYNSQVGNCTLQSDGTCIAPLGNPPGAVPFSKPFTGVNGETLGVPATMTTDVNWASANVPGSAATGADEKRVIVTITRDSDGKVLATATTYVAPKYQASQTSATVQATVTDIGNNSDPNGTTLEGVRVTLTPPSGLSPPIPPGPESDTTDDSGTVIFPGVTPTSGSQLYSIGIDSADLPSLYYQVPVDDFDLSPTQVISPPLSVQVYQPVKLYVALQQGVACPPTCSPFTGAATIVVTAGSGGTSWTFTHNFTAADYPTGFQISTQGPSSTTPLLPNIDYSIAVTANGYNETDDDNIVPANGVYPATNASDLNYTFNETMVKLVPPAAEIDVKVQMVNSFGTVIATCSNASTNATVTAGPQSANYGPTAVSGSPTPLAKFPNPPDTNIVSNVSPYDTTAYTIVAKTTTNAGHNLTGTVSLSGVSGTTLYTFKLTRVNTSDTSC